MGTSGDGSGKLDELGARIRAARNARKPERSRAGDKYKAASMAWRMVFELVVAVMIGAAMGWGLDALFGTRPVFLIVFVLLGFAAGVRMMMRAAGEIQNDRAADTANDD